MKYNLSTKNIALEDQDYVLMEKKLDRLQKHLSPPFQVDVRFTRDTHHKTGDVVTCRMNIEHAKHVYHAERSGGSVQDALDDAIAAISQELSKQHDKQKERHD